MTTGEEFHGGMSEVELQRYGIDATQAIDFSSNILAYGPSPRVQAAICQTEFAAYPDRDCRKLRAAIAGRDQIDSAQVLVGNGSSELIHLIAQSLIQPSEPVLIVGPSFSEYHRASQLALGKVTECRASAGNQFAVPLHQIESQLGSRAYKLVWLCNPNNPTGASVASEDILRLVRSFPQTLFVIDESYIEFAERRQTLVGFEDRNFIILRSMTKGFGIAGLRLGYMVAQPNLIKRLCERRVPWSVSSMAQAAGIAAIADTSYYDNAFWQTKVAKRELFTALTNSGFSPVPSDANFFLLPFENATQIRTLLLADGIVVRDCTSFNLQGYLRVAVREPASNQRLIRALTQLRINSMAEGTLRSAVI